MRKAPRSSIQTSGGLHVAKREQITTACEECRRRKCKVGDDLAEYILCQPAESWVYLLARKAFGLVSYKMHAESMKCMGQRPVCEACQRLARECHYTREPGERLFTALKRDYEALRSRNAQEHEILTLLRHLPARQASEVLMLLRTVGNVSIAVRMARSFSAATSTTGQVEQSNQQNTETSMMREDKSTDFAGIPITADVTEHSAYRELRIDPSVSVSCV